MSLPETTADDLRHMGITPEAIKTQVERRGHQVEGKIVGYFLPDAGWKGDTRIRRARNSLKVDWKLVLKNPPEVVKRDNFDQSFKNFDGDVPLDVTYFHKGLITTGNDYAQTQSFDIHVDANIPLGRHGPLVGFNAAMTAEDVKDKSKTETVTRDISFPLTVPSHEGRIVSQTTTVTSTDHFYESALRAEGTVGIEVDPGFWTPNVYYFFYNIESVFPYAEATSHITRSSIDTDIATKVLKMTKPTDDGNTEILEYIPFDFDPPAAALDLESPEDLGFAFSEEEIPPSPFEATAKLTIRIQFAGVKPEVPIERRQALATTFRGRIYYSAITFPRSSLTPVTLASGKISASLSLKYDTAVISKEKIKAEITKIANAMKWEGKVKIYFS